MVELQSAMVERQPEGELEKLCRSSYQLRSSRFLLISRGALAPGFRNRKNRTLNALRLITPARGPFSGAFLQLTALPVVIDLIKSSLP
jgi:hypothetical protein